MIRTNARRTLVEAFKKINGLTADTMNMMIAKVDSFVTSDMSEEEIVITSRAIVATVLDPMNLAKRDRVNDAHALIRTMRRGKSTPYDQK